MYHTNKNAVRDNLAQKVTVLGLIVYISPVAVLKDNSLYADIVQAGVQAVNVLQKQLSADETLVVNAKSGHSVHQEVGPLVVVQAQQQIQFDKSVASQQRLKTINM